MLTILISAYACCPNHGSEPGMAWNWCVHLASHCNLHIITESEFKDQIETALLTLPQAKNMHFYFNPIPEKARKMCWNQGDWRFYWYYRRWQKQTLDIARIILVEQRIDVMHQLNMIGAHGVGYLWKLKDIPYVWGPFGGLGYDAPSAFLKGAGFKTLSLILLKQMLKYFTVRAGNIRRNILHADKLIAANSDNKRRVERLYGRTVECINETGLYPSANNKYFDPSKKTFDIIWVGRFIHTKRLDIAIKTIEKLSDCPDIRLHIIGSGTKSQEIYYRKLARESSVQDKCIFYGQKKHEEVISLMQQSDLLLFTSTYEGTPHVILEAIQNKLPIICFDCCGQGDCIDGSIGIKIPLKSPLHAINNFSSSIRYIYNNKDFLQKLSYNSSKKQIELSWEYKTQKMLGIYQSALKKKYPSN